MTTLSLHLVRSLVVAAALLAVVAAPVNADTKSEARALYKQGKYTEALTKFREAVHQQPTDPHLWWNLGFTYRKLKQYDRALASFEKAGKLDPKHGFASTPGKYEETIAATRKKLAAQSKAGKGKGGTKPPQKKPTPA
jgi:tetratricopeptide (TPR) repeat protein